MTKKSGTWLSLRSFGLLICLAFPACRTAEEKVSDSKEVSTSSDVVRRVTQKLKAITIPEMTFRPPATIVDAIDFFKQASIDYDDPSVPLDQRGVSFILCLNHDTSPVAVAGEPVDVFATASNSVFPVLAGVSVRFISLYDALELVCEVSDAKWCVAEGGYVLITPREWHGDCITRSYTVPQALSDKLFNECQGSDFGADSNKVWEVFFKQLGAIGKNSKIEYLPVIGKLRVTNTQENLDTIEKVFNHFTFPLRMVEAEMQIHAFRTLDIERLRLSDGISLESLMTLREKGKAKPVATATVLTKSGQQAIMKTVKELLYPTELIADVPLTDSNLTERAGAQAVMAASFATREIGMILEVVPEATRNGMCINLSLKPQWVTLEGWESYPAYMSAGWMHTSPSFKQPIIGVTSFETQVLVKDGETVLLGSSSTPDGEWVQVGFLTTRLKNVHPELLASRTDKPKPRDTSKDAEVEKKMRATVLPAMDFRPPATIIDAIDFFKQASIDYDKSALPEAQRGINLSLKLPANGWGRIEKNTNTDVCAVSYTENRGVPVISAITARFLTLYDALKLVCDVTDMKFKIKDGIVWIVPLNHPSEGMDTRMYYFDQVELLELIRNGGENNEQTAKNFYNQLGVNWPAGSSLALFDAIGAIRVTNTPENLAVFEQVLEDFSGVHPPRMVEVDMQIHAFPAEAIEQLGRFGNITMEELMTLRKKGKSHQVASSMIVTKSGQEAVMKSVREVIYPSELLTDFDQSGSNVTVQTATQTLAPGGFVMRETGMVLQVVPEVSDADRSAINVTLKPTWVTLDCWENYPADRAAGWTHNKIPFKQPVFGVTCFETQTLVKDGGTVLLGSASTQDGKWVHVGFLTLKKLISGDTIKDASKQATAQ